MPTIISKPGNEKYRQEYDRIFQKSETQRDIQGRSKIMRERFKKETGQEAIEVHHGSAGPTWEYCQYLEKKVLELETAAV